MIIRDHFQSISWARWLQSAPSHSVVLRSILILSPVYVSVKPGVTCRRLHDLTNPFSFLVLWNIHDLLDDTFISWDVLLIAIFSSYQQHQFRTHQQQVPHIFEGFAARGLPSFFVWMCTIHILSQNAHSLSDTASLASVSSFFPKLIIFLFSFMGQNMMASC